MDSLIGHWLIFSTNIAFSGYSLTITNEGYCVASTTATHFNSIAIGVGSESMPTVVRQGWLSLK